MCFSGAPPKKKDKNTQVAKPQLFRWMLVILLAFTQDFWLPTEKGIKNQSPEVRIWPIYNDQTAEVTPNGSEL